MKYIFIYIFLIRCLASFSQQTVHQGVFYRDDESVTSGFLSDKAEEIEDRLSILKNNNCYVNVLLMSKECPPLSLINIDGKVYYSGPFYNDNGNESSLWLSSDANYYVIQFLPRQARVYYSNNSTGSFWEASNIDFDTPVLHHNDNYYCAIIKSLNLIFELKGLPIAPLSTLCQEGDSAAVYSNISTLPKIYLNRKSDDIADLRRKQVLAKNNFCTNLVYYAPYLHTRSIDPSFQNELEVSSSDGYLLVTAIPGDINGGAIYKEVLFDVNPGSGYPNNCFPLLREISEQDRLDVLYQLHNGSNSGNETDFQGIIKGTNYLLKSLLSSASNPVPGNTQCDYGESSTPDLSWDYQYVSQPYTQFSGSGISPAKSESGVTWYNNFNTPIIDDCQNAMSIAAANGLDLKFSIASGCTPNASQFTQSLENHTNLILPSNSASIWMYYDECDNRLYFDVRLSDAFSTNIASGFGIQNPDSIQKIVNHIEQLAIDMISGLSKIESYANADLYEDEYPENMHHPEMISFFGTGSTCGSEAPWRFGLRDGYEFNLPEMTSECVSMLWRIFTEQSIPQSLWHPQPTEESMLDMPGGAAGIIDACLNLVDGKVWNLTGLLTASVEYYKADAATRKEILKSLTDPVNLILGQYPQNFECINTSECQEERIYCFTNLLSNALIDIFGRGLVSVIGNISNAGATASEKLKMFVGNFDDNYNIWKRTLNEVEQQRLHVFMEGLSEASKYKMAKHVVLNKIWAEVESGNLPGVSQTDLKNFIEKTPPYQALEYYTELENILLDSEKKINNPNLLKNLVSDYNNPDREHIITIFAESPKKYLRAWKDADAANLSNLRVNVEFLSTLNDFYDGKPTQHFTEYGCSLIDEGLIRLYTGDYHHKLNLALVGADPMTEEFVEFREAFKNAFDKLPNYSGSIVYRGLGDFESNVASSWEKGTKISSANWDKKILSTSVSEDQARIFMNNGSGNFLVTIEVSSKGKFIAPISKYPNELEVIYFGTDMEVDNIIKDSDDPDYYTIYLIEI